MNPLTLLFSRPGPTHTLLTCCTAPHRLRLCVCDLRFTGTHTAKHMQCLFMLLQSGIHTNTLSPHSLCSLAIGLASFGPNSHQQQQPNDSGANVCVHPCRHASPTLSLASCCKGKPFCYRLGCQVCSPPIRSILFSKLPP